MRGLPGLRERRRQHRRSPSRCQRSTVAGWTSTNPSLHRVHDRRNNSHNRRSEARKRRFERARTPNWCRRARHSSRRSRRVDQDNRTAATARKTSGIARRVASHCGNVNLCLPGRDNGERQVAPGVLDPVRDDERSPVFWFGSGTVNRSLGKGPQDRETEQRLDWRAGREPTARTHGDHLISRS